MRVRSTTRMLSSGSMRGMVRPFAASSFDSPSDWAKNGPSEAGMSHRPSVLLSLPLLVACGSGPATPIGEPDVQGVWGGRPYSWTWSHIVGSSSTYSLCGGTLTVTSQSGGSFEGVIGSGT